MGRVENTYARLPSALQHAAISLQEYRFRCLRYAAYTCRAFTFLMESQHWALDLFEDCRLARLRRLVTRVCLYLSYYWEQRAALDVGAGMLKTPVVVFRLPPISKRKFRQDATSFACSDIKRRHSRVITSMTSIPLSWAGFIRQSHQECSALTESRGAFPFGGVRNGKKRLSWARRTTERNEAGSPATPALMGSRLAHRRALAYRET